MSIVIQVRSIILPQALRRVNGPPNYSTADWEYVHEICRAFSWDKTPWDEPSDVIGSIDVSYSETGFKALLDIAIEHQQNHHFTQLLNRDVYTNIYIPFDFQPPIHRDNPLVGSFSVGSSRLLMDEVALLHSVVGQLVTKHGPDAVIFKRTKYSLSDIYSIVDDLRTACVESNTLSLPILIRW